MVVEIRQHFKITISVVKVELWSRNLIAHIRAHFPENNELNIT
jgi:hypothetical protein